MAAACQPKGAVTPAKHRARKYEHVIAAKRHEDPILGIVGKAPLTPNPLLDGPGAAPDGRQLAHAVQHVRRDFAPPLALAALRALGDHVVRQRRHPHLSIANGRILLLVV
jgi:hypothetical protein